MIDKKNKSRIDPPQCFFVTSTLNDHYKLFVWNLPNVIEMLHIKIKYNTFM